MVDLQLEGKVALVTGSSKGIGAGIAQGLAREGAVVVIHGRDPDQTEYVAEQIRTTGNRALVATGDLTDDAQVAAMIDTIVSTVGNVDILVNNAGGSGDRTDWNTTTPVAWSAAYDRNVLAAIRVTTAVLPQMRQAKWGRIINIASLAGLMPPPVNPDYSAAKAAMITMSASMAKAVAAEGVTVNTVSPGTIRSEKLEKKFREVAAEHGLAKDASWDEVERIVLPFFATVPVGRVGTLAEIADAVSFLASPRAAYITGSNIRLDGGMLPTL